MWVIHSLLWLVAFLAMEGVAYYTHKYIMHGFLWSFHRRHHQSPQGGIFSFEHNDVFGLIFLIPAILCVVFGNMYESVAFLSYIGYGIFTYGGLYVFFHDILVHQRLSFFSTSKRGYLRRLVDSHHVHHRKHTKTGCECFGFFFVPKRCV